MRVCVCMCVSEREGVCACAEGSKEVFSKKSHNVFERLSEYFSSIL